MELTYFKNTHDYKTVIELKDDKLIHVFTFMDKTLHFVSVRDSAYSTALYCWDAVNGWGELPDTDTRDRVLAAQLEALALYDDRYKTPEKVDL